MTKKDIAWSIYGASIILYLASLSTGILLLMNIHKRFVLKIDSVTVKNQLVLYGSLAIASFIAAICTMVLVNHLVDKIKSDLGITNNSAAADQGACLNVDDICCMALCLSCCGPNIRCSDDEGSAICLIFAGVASLIGSLFGYLYYAYKTKGRLNNLKADGYSAVSNNSQSVDGDACPPQKQVYYQGYSGYPPAGDYPRTNNLQGNCFPPTAPPSYSIVDPNTKQSAIPDRFIIS